MKKQFTGGATMPLQNTLDLPLATQQSADFTSSNGRKTTRTNPLLVAACLGFFPLMYVMGRFMMTALS